MRPQTCIKRLVIPIAALWCALHVQSAAMASIVAEDADFSAKSVTAMTSSGDVPTPIEPAYLESQSANHATSFGTASTSSTQVVNSMAIGTCTVVVSEKHAPVRCYVLEATLLANPPPDGIFHPPRNTAE